jgi:NADH:ubiquinone oxidoreductase subunit E
MRNLAKPQLIDFMKAKTAGEPVTSEIINGMVDELPEPQKGMLARALAGISGSDDGFDASAVEKIIENYPEGEESLITMLHDIQARFGYVPEGAVKVISRKTGAMMSKLYHLITACRAFKVEPPRKNILTVCNGTCCHLKKGSELLNKIKEKASREGSEITLETARCLGMCDMSPALLVNGIPYSGIDAEAQLEKITG